MEARNVLEMMQMLLIRSWLRTESYVEDIFAVLSVKLLHKMNQGDVNSQTHI